MQVMPCVVLCCAVLCCVMLYHAVLDCARLCYAVLCCTRWCFVLFVTNEYLRRAVSIHLHHMHSLWHGILFQSVGWYGASHKLCM